MAGEALIDLFSSLSHKRKHGTLRLTSAGTVCDLSFFDGRIIDVSQPAGSDARDICSRLVRAGLMPEKIFQLVQSKPISVAQLFDLLVSKKFISASDFQRAKRAHDLDLLHALGYAEDATFEFRAGDLRPDPRFPLSISPSQLLLDYCELQADEERFQTYFGSNGPPISRSAGDPKGLCDFERAVWQIVNGSRRAADLFHRLLSEYEVKEGLLALLDRGLIDVERPVSAPIAAPAPPPLAVTAAPEDDLSLSEVDDPSDLMGKIALEAVDSILDGFEDDISLTELSESVIERPAAETKPPAATPIVKPSVPVAAAKIEQSPAILSPSAAKEVLGLLPIAAPEAVTTQKNVLQTLPSVRDLVVQFLREARERGTKTALFDMNHLFLEKNTLEQITLVTILAYLVSLSILCLLGVGLIEPWFKALAEFTSAASSFMVE